MDKTSFVTKCTTHVRGAKCEISMDSHFRHVTITGVGHKTWRDYKFPLIARSLFQRLVNNTDEQYTDDLQLTQENDASTDVHVQLDATPANDPVFTSTPLVPKHGTGIIR